jgi:hypothetical protein
VLVTKNVLMLAFRATLRSAEIVFDDTVWSFPRARAAAPVAEENGE